ncbi:MAG: UDP-N-acetylmuramate dehydrogenase [Alphaproteobacteria bacterium]
MTKKLIETLPTVRGRYRENVDLSATTWFRVGGKAEVVFRPEDTVDLAHFIKNKPADVPVTVMGAASNLLVRDGGIDGVVIRLGKGFNSIQKAGDALSAGAACLDLTLAQFAQAEGMGGLEFLSGIPGTIGGALRMNAGAYGAEMQDVVVGATALDLEGNIRRLSLEDLGFDYRTCVIPQGWIFTEVLFKTVQRDPTEIQKHIQEILETRGLAQPTRARTGGSTFKNPDGSSAWELVDQAGCRGLKHGGAQVSEKHCNFLINTGDATAQDIEELGDIVRAKVLEKTEIDLHWEIKRIGKK